MNYDGRNYSEPMFSLYSFKNVWIGKKKIQCIVLVFEPNVEVRISARARGNVKYDGQTS